MDREALVQAILNLENDIEDQVTDPDLAFELADHIKVYVDELATLGAGQDTSGKRKRKKRNNNRKRSTRSRKRSVVSMRGGADNPQNPAVQKATKPPML